MPSLISLEDARLVLQMSTLSGMECIGKVQIMYSHRLKTRLIRVTLEWLTPGRIER